MARPDALNVVTQVRFLLSQLYAKRVLRGPFVQRLRIPVLQAEDNGSIPLGATPYQYKRLCNKQ